MSTRTVAGQPLTPGNPAAWEPPLLAFQIGHRWGRSPTRVPLALLNAIHPFHGQDDGLLHQLGATGVQVGEFG